MDIAVVIGILSGIAVIISVVYKVVFGSKTLKELIESRKSIPTPTPDDSSEILLTEAQRLTTLSCDRGGKLVAFGGFSHQAFILEINSKEFTELPPHESPVRCVKWFSSESAVASGGDDGVARLIYPSAKEQRVFGRHDGAIYDIACHPLGKVLATAGNDGEVKLWDIRKAPIHAYGSALPFKAQPIRCHKHKEGTVFSVDFNPKNNSLVSAGVAGVINIWDMGKGKPERLVGTKETVFCVRFDHSGDLLGSCGADGDVRVWNLNTHQCQILSGHTNAVRFLDFHPSGRFIVSASKDRTLRLWHIETSQSWVLEGHTDYVYTVEFHPDGNHIFSVGGDGTLRQWDLPQSARNILGFVQ